MKKQDLEKKKKIKELIFKIIHSITYVLSALFIVVCIAVGVQSCSKSKGQSNKVNRDNIQNRIVDFSFNFDYEGLFYLKYNSGDTMEWSDQLDIANYCEVDIENTYPMINLPDVQKTIIAPLDTIYGYVDNEVVNFTYFFVNFRGYPISDGAVRGIYRIRTIQAWVGGAAHDICRKVNSNDYDLVYNFGDSVSKLFLRKENYSNVILNRLYIYYDANNMVDFAFNNQINYNAPIGGTIEQPFINRSGGDYQYTYDFWFYSGGQLFNQIKVFYFDANAVHFLLSDNTKYLYSGLNSAVYYSMMYYNNTLTGNQVLVNSRNMSPFQNGSGVSYVVENSSTWSSQYYRNISIINPSDEDLLTVSRFNNNIGTTSSIGYTNIGLGNVFTLLSDAFLSIFPLISIQIIPGLTIGLLLFLPLVVSIIILVFKAVKK